MSVQHITHDNYPQLVQQAPGKVLLDFWAPWCSPCRMIGPIVEEIAQEYPNITVGKINVDEEPALASQFGIVSIPTLLLVEGGEVIATQVGYMPKAELEKFLGV